jgi:hypothetical protein
VFCYNSRIEIQESRTMKIEHRSQTRTLVSSTASSFNVVVAVLFCACSLALVKIIALVLKAAQAIGRALRLSQIIQRYSITIAVLGLGTAAAAILLRSTQIANTVSVKILIIGAFCLGLVLMTTAGSNEGTRAGRVNLHVNPSRPCETWFVQRMRHRDDAVWVRLLFVVSLMVWPALAMMVRTESFGLVTILMYSAVMSVTSTAIVNFEHADSHYHFFRTHRATSPLARLVFTVIDVYVKYVLSLALARVPNWYEVQHVVIHHAEDNGPNDTQSTLEYDRASFIDFARCAHRFALSGLVSADVIAYLVKNKRRKALRSLLAGLIAFYAFIVALALINWRCAVVILIWRYISGIMSTTGFFQEHGIVDVSRPTNIYTNSLHFIAPDNSHGSRGEDFHIAHHLRPAHHWTNYQCQVGEEMAQYEAQGAVGFIDGAGHVSEYFQLLWKRDFVGLTKYFVRFGSQMSEVEMAELLRARTRPLSCNRNTCLAWDLLLGRCAGYLLP